MSGRLAGRRNLDGATALAFTPREAALTLAERLAIRAHLGPDARLDEIADQWGVRMAFLAWLSRGRTDDPRLVEDHTTP